jgi:hypothetical protein
MVGTIHINQFEWTYLTLNVTYESFGSIKSKLPEEMKCLYVGMLGPIHIVEYGGA